VREARQRLGPLGPTPESQASRDEAELREKLGRWNVPKQYLDVNWDQAWLPDGFVAGEWKGDLLRAALRRGKGLLIGGPTGTGKSSLAALIARETALAGLRVRWEYVPTMIDTMEFGKAERLAVEERQRTAGLVVWDDFGVDELADWQIGFIDRIVEQRYGSGRSMIITTNTPFAELKADLRLGRIMSRWRQRNLGLTINGEDRRVFAR